MKRDATQSDLQRLRLGEAADRLGVSPETVRRWADDGRLPATRTAGGQRTVAAADVARLTRLLQALGLPVEPPRIALEQWLTFMGRDKKNEQGRITLVLLDALGQGVVVKEAPLARLERFLAG